jgi:hypothetical protein
VTKACSWKWTWTRPAQSSQSDRIRKGGTRERCRTVRRQVKDLHRKFSSFVPHSGPPCKAQRRSAIRPNRPSLHMAQSCRSWVELMPRRSFRIAAIRASCSILSAQTSVCGRSCHSPLVCQRLLCCKVHRANQLL